MPRKPRLFSLTFKVNLILIAALAVGIGAIMVAFAVSIVAFRNQLTIQSLMRQGDDHFVAIETLMISGNAPEAVGYFMKVNLTNAATTITLYRQDGTRAFSDNSTIERVNQNLKMARFQIKDRPPPPGMTMPTPQFKEAAGLPPRGIFQGRRWLCSWWWEGFLSGIPAAHQPSKVHSMSRCGPYCAWSH